MNVFIVLVGIFAPIAATDVGSLMQVGVKGHASQGVALALDQITQDLNDMPLSDPANKLAISALMANVYADEDLDPSSKIALDNVSTTLGLILTQLVKERGTLQTTIDNHRKAMVDSNTEDWETLTGTDPVGSQTLMETARSTHNSCRGNVGDASTADTEYAEFANAASTCGALYSYMGGVGVPGSPAGHCVAPTISFAGYNVDDDFLWNDPVAANSITVKWTKWFKDGETDSKNDADGFPAKRDPCLEDTKTLEAKIGVCSGNQLDFEKAFCTYDKDLSDVCDTRHTDFHIARANWNNSVGSWTDDSDVRGKEAAVIKHIECLIDNLLKTPAETNPTLCASIGSDASVTAYDIYRNFFDTVPTEAVCPSSGPIPGDGTFATHANSGYDDLDATTPVSDPGHSC